VQLYKYRQDLADFDRHVVLLWSNFLNRQYLADSKGAMMTFTEVSEAIQSRRKALGLTQLELADLAEVSERLVRDLETGRATIKTDKLLSILEALGLEIRIHKIHSEKR
jgi:y4mF family transcriptional regulator